MTLTTPQLDKMTRTVLAFFLDSFTQLFYPHLRDQTESFKQDVLTNELSILDHPQVKFKYIKRGTEEIVNIGQFGEDFYGLIRTPTGINACVHEDDGTGHMKPILLWICHLKRAEVEIEALFDYYKTQATLLN